MKVSKTNGLNISVAAFASEVSTKLSIEVLAGQKGLKKRKIDSPKIQKLGLALTGFSQYLHEGRVLILGESEISYLNRLDDSGLETSVKNLDLERISCILVSKSLNPPNILIDLANDSETPVFRTPLTTSSAITIISSVLGRELAPSTTVHGVMVGIYDLGVLILGESGIGKSECALDLISRGHRLISDDSVLVKKIDAELEACSPALTQDHLEVRGLGIINVRDLFGISAIGGPRKIDLCIELVSWESFEDVDRIGLKMKEQKILGLELPLFVLPVSSGRSIATMVDTAVRVFLIKSSGADGLKEFIEKHTAAVSGNR